MLSIFISIFIYLLAFYGAIVLVLTIVNSMRFRVQEDNPKMKLIVLVKDNEDNVEGAVRGIFSGELLRKLRVSGKLTMLDMGSKDDTKKILSKLADEYPHLEFVEEPEKEKIFEGF